MSVVMPSPIPPQPGEPCPECGRRVPIPKEDKTPRKRAQKNISVPKDAGENGIEVLETALQYQRDEVISLCDRGYTQSTPDYYIICDFTQLYRETRDELAAALRVTG